MRSASVSFNFSLFSDWRRVGSAPGAAGSWSLRIRGSEGSESVRRRRSGPAHALSREAGPGELAQGPSTHLTPVRNMASALLLLSFPWPARPGPLRRCWELLQQLQQSWNGVVSPQWAPALAVQGPPILTELAHDTSGNKEESSFLDSIFWMAAPKNRRTIEVNRCRRRNPRKLIAIKNNIDMCPECGHLKQKHVLCGYCYEKVREETTKIRQQIWAQEGGPLKAPTVETVVLYTGEKPSEQDHGKRIVERNMKRPSWFTQN